MSIFKDYLASKRLKKIKTTRNIKVRTLVVGDFFKASDMIEVYAEELDLQSVQRLISSIQNEGQTDSPDEETVSKQVQSIGVEILKKFTTIAKTDVVEFFSDLIGVSPEEFKEMPIDTPLVIIEQIRTSPEAGSFFIMQSLGHKLTGMFAEPLGMLKKWYDSTSEEPEVEPEMEKPVKKDS